MFFVVCRRGPLPLRGALYASAPWGGMFSLAKLPSARLLPGAIMMLLAAVLAAPSAARAGCDNHSPTLRPRLPDGIPPGLPLSSADKLRPVDDKATPAPHDSRPCSGPNCSRKQLPPPSPVRSIPAGPEQWAWVCSLPLLPPLEPTAGWLPDEPLRCQCQGSSVFHPPRLFQE
jgi:hypothetical protein